MRSGGGKKTERQAEGPIFDVDLELVAHRVKPYAFGWHGSAADEENQQTASDVDVRGGTKSSSVEALEEGGDEENGVGKLVLRQQVRKLAQRCELDRGRCKELVGERSGD